MKISSPCFVPEANISVLSKAMNPTPDSFTPPASLAEEWDNPAMAEFKRQFATSAGTLLVNDEPVAALDEDTIDPTQIKRAVRG